MNALRRRHALRQPARRLLNIRTHSAMAASGGCFRMDMVSACAVDHRLCIAKANAKGIPHLKLQPRPPQRPQRRLINCGPPSLSCACTYTELGLARTRCPVPIYCLSAPLPLGARFEVRGFPERTRFAFLHLHKPPLHARQSAARDKLPWASWPHWLIHSLQEQPRKG